MGLVELEGQADVRRRSLRLLIIHSVSGLQIGEPLWQIGQLWRGGVLTRADRVKTTLFSPFDGLHDALRVKPGRWWRPRAWRSMVFEAGAERRQIGDDVSHSQGLVVGDIDLVRDRRYLLPGRQRGGVKPGTWSRIRGRLAIGDVDSTAVTSTHLRTRTAIAGTYRQNADGDGFFAAVGTGFTYHRDRLAESWDHVAIAHIVGPQLQLLTRQPGLRFASMPPCTGLPREACCAAPG